MPRAYISEKVKEKVHKRAHACCEYCQSSDELATHRFYIEHVIPVSKGGDNEVSNLALGCPGCNNHKYNKLTGIDAFDNTEVKLFNPRKQKWTDHFIWDESFIKIVGLTPAGRATIDALKLNRPRLITRRKAFFAMGFHPPKHTILE